MAKEIKRFVTGVIDKMSDSALSLIRIRRILKDYKT
jgi:hypothetical protein